MTEVLVLGAGPTGLMAALCLVRSGATVRIVDRRATPSQESRAGVMSARTVELFASLGLAEAVFARGVPNSEFDIFIGGRRAGGLRFDHADVPDTPYPFLAMIPQAATEEILIDALAEAGVAVERGIEATGLRQDEVGVTMAVRDGEPLPARYVIGADGAHSMVRHALGLPFDGASYGQSFLLGDVRADWDLAGERFRVFLNGDRLGLYVPFQGDGVARVMCTEHGENAGADLSLDELQRGFAEAAGRPVRLHDPVWLARFSASRRMVDRFRVGRVFVAGDAAHIHSPAGGQGMNTGLQDAANLAWKLAAVLRGDGSGPLLDSYAAERMPVARHVLGLTDTMFDTVAGQHGWRARVRDVLAPFAVGAASHVDRVQTLAFRALSQLDVGYVASDADGPSPRVGARAPDAPIRRGRDLHELLAGYRPVALALSRKRLPIAEATALAEALGAIDGVTPRIVARIEGPAHPAVERVERADVFDRYGLAGDDAQALLLIRPDGYVAWRTESLDAPALLRAWRDLLQPEVARSVFSRRGDG